MVKQSRTLQCSNKVMPDGLTEAFKQKILLLGQSAKADYLKQEFFSKFVSDDTAPADVRRARAINKWLATERENEATNDRLIFTPDDHLLIDRVPFGKFVSFCRNLISEIIGDTVPHECLIGSFSGGASTSRNRTESHPAQKYLGKAHVTQRCLDEVFLSCLVEDLPGWLRVQHNLELEIVPGNVLFTVPKKTDIDRCACKEPDINMFLQKGAGNYIRRSLRRIGINLNDQSINSSLARIGSIDGSLATLDLSSASDSVSSGLVALLLPECWYTHLDALRSPVTIIDGETHRNEMFSSMGNGFTFELESLLFYVLARATCYFTGTSGKVSVYGDDIICPTAAALPLVEVLEYFGFSTNEEKSFVSGPFRESCGGHYLDGYDVTPFYIKGPLKHMTDVIDAANKLRRWAEVPGLDILDCEVEDVWLWLKNYIPSYLWGGVDTTYKYQLVSNDEPVKRLHPETKKQSTGTGGYLHWLNATWDRRILHDGVETSSYLREKGLYRLKNVRTPAVTRVTSVFLHEIG